ncbi:unnamed protein product [Trifolium pratense]|uniref:Uncharacterized protein n=1 Tax=Trifolium pratense TaxID=57577 RepID=A0ACB0IWZ7_TRIPR|nr:unnamed protein product [Trifolium pratense]
MINLPFNQVSDEDEVEAPPPPPPPPQNPDDPKPIGDPFRVSGKVGGRKKHYDSFEFDGKQYSLEDPVMLVPEDKEQKPYVVIIKDIIQNFNGSIMVSGQWFYRPEEAEKKGGGRWKSRDSRELFYSFHRDEVYDTLERKLWNLTDEDFEDVKQQEIAELVQKTRKRIGELLDIEPEEAPPADKE